MPGMSNLPQLNSTGPVDGCGFASLSLSPVRNVATHRTSGTQIEICSPDEATMISIYGITQDGEAVCLTDEPDATIALALAKRLSMQYGLGVSWFDETNGAVPNEPTHDFTTLAEWLTDIIHDDLGDCDRDDAFDAHPLSPLRETAIQLSDDAGPGTAVHLKAARIG